MPLIASKAAFALKSLLYFFGELAMSFLLADACFLPAILSHGPVQFSAPIIPSPLPSDIPRLIKGQFSRLLRQEFAHLRNLPALWSPSSFLSTAGNVSSETIQRSI
jgi:hypothetical protein